MEGVELGVGGTWVLDTDSFEYFPLPCICWLLLLVFREGVSVQKFEQKFNKVRGSSWIFSTTRPNASKSKSNCKPCKARAIESECQLFQSLPSTLSVTVSDSETKKGLQSTNSSPPGSSAAAASRTPEKQNAGMLCCFIS